MHTPILHEVGQMATALNTAVSGIKEALQADSVDWCLALWFATQNHSAMPRIHQLPLATLRRGAGEGARALALALLAQVGATLPHLQTRKNNEALHDFRVAVRRLRSCLRSSRSLFGKKAITIWRKRLREIVTTTGSARDAEVGLQWIDARKTCWTRADLKGVNLVRARLCALMEEGYLNGQEVVKREYPEVEKSLYNYLNDFEPVSDGTFADYLASSIGEHKVDLAGKLAGAFAPIDANRMHRARISAKRLRYLIEPLVSEVSLTPGVVDQLKSLQGLLGDIRDLQGLERGIHVALNGLNHEREEWFTNLSSGPVGPPRQSSAELSGLTKLARVAREDQDRLLNSLRERWMDGAAAQFFDDVAELQNPAGWPAKANPQVTEP